MSVIIQPAYRERIPVQTPKPMNAFQFNPFASRFQREDSPAPAAEPEQSLHRLNNNENPLGPSPRVVEAIQSIAPTLASYPKFTDIDLRRAIAEQLGRGLSPQHIFTGCSGFEALELIMRATLSPGDEVILSSPTFAGAYKKVALPQGAKIIDVPLEPQTFRYRPEAALAAISDRTKLVMLCNPNNPTGTIIESSAVERLMRDIPEHVLVVMDAVYHHFVEDSAYPDALQYVHEGRNVVIARSFSKAYGLAGLRLGYGIAKPEIANVIAGLHRGFHQNALALAAGIAALNDQAHVRRVVAFVREESRWVCAQFERLKVRYWQPAANFILFETPLPADDLQAALRQRGFLLRSQTSNGLPYCMRLSLGTREANSGFIDSLEDILKPRQAP